MTEIDIGDADVVVYDQDKFERAAAEIREKHLHTFSEDQLKLLAYLGVYDAEDYL